MKVLIVVIFLVVSLIVVVVLGVSVGIVSINDVILVGQKVNNFVWLIGNVQFGLNGDSLLFSSFFGGGIWDLLGKVDFIGVLLGFINLVLGFNLMLSFSLVSGSKIGIWIIIFSKSLQMDLVLGIYVGNVIGFFFFDNLVLIVGQIQSGIFVINWKNNGGQILVFFNVILFSFNVVLCNVVVVLEFLIYVMLLVGLVVVGWMVMCCCSKFVVVVLLVVV